MTKTTIISNGSRWAGQSPATIEDLLDVLGKHPLSGTHAPFIHHSEICGSTRFFGNFATVSHVFNIDTDDPELIATLTAAIAQNQTRPDYEPLHQPWDDEDHADTTATASDSPPLL